MFAHKATPASVEVAFRSWFKITNTKAVMKYSVYDGETGMNSLDIESGELDGREAQELLSEGLVDMSILKGEGSEVGEEEAGKDYDSDNGSTTSRVLL